MAKRQSFADKAKKEKMMATCPICNSLISNALLVRAGKNRAGSYNYKQNRVRICNCNQEELLG